MLEILLAVAIDSVAGDPPDERHPVAWLGRLIAGLEKHIYPRDSGAAGGSLLVAATVACAMLVVLAFLKAASRLGRLPRVAAGAAVISYTISLTSLRKTARAIKASVERGRLPEARQRLRALAGRDADGLSGQEVCRAVIESVAENLSDGVVAPLFYAAVGGPVLAAAYRAANTLDSMVGYRNERYAKFGAPAARLDDLANLLPARLTALALLLAGALDAKDARRAAFVVRRDAPGHKSPNAGWPEAAMAGLLEVQLGGTGLYGGVEVACPLLGDPVEEMGAHKVDEAVRLASISFALALTLVLALRLAARRLR
jgi:adenosylcobinamide-phosphate synthase